MNADAFRHFYNYHFAENRKIWNAYIVNLTQEQFTQDVPYSMGSVRNQIVHLIDVDNAWFSDLSGQQIAESLDPANTDDRTKIREYGDKVEQGVREYLAKLQDDRLFTKPLTGEDENLILWQVLLHVANHGTDHRAQMLRIIHDLGLKTGPQDYVFYIYDNHA